MMSDCLSFPSHFPEVGGEIIKCIDNHRKQIWGKTSDLVFLKFVDERVCECNMESVINMSRYDSLIL